MTLQEFIKSIRSKVGTKYYDIAELYEEEVDILLKIIELQGEALDKIKKNRYGAQGYVEEGDVEGLASYWAQTSINYQDISRQTQSEIQKLLSELK